MFHGRPHLVGRCFEDSQWHKLPEASGRFHGHGPFHGDVGRDVAPLLVERGTAINDRVHLAVVIMVIVYVISYNDYPLLNIVDQYHDND